MSRDDVEVRINILRNYTSIEVSGDIRNKCVQIVNNFTRDRVQTMGVDVVYEHYYINEEGEYQEKRDKDCQVRGTWYRNGDKEQSVTLNQCFFFSDLPTQVDPILGVIVFGVLKELIESKKFGDEFKDKGVNVEFVDVIDERLLRQVQIYTRAYMEEKKEENGGKSTKKKRSKGVIIY